MDSYLASLKDSWKNFFILEFTHELIRNSGEDLFKLKKITEESLDETKHHHEQRKTKIKEEPIEELKKEIASETKKIQEPVSTPLRSIMAPSTVNRNMKSLIVSATKKILSAPVLRIPEAKLPPRFEYLKPLPHNKEIDLGKINPLVQDPMVRNIECNGPNQNVVVAGTMGTKKTNIILSGDEIEEVVERFSREAKIPAHEGVFKVVVGKLIFSAVISNVIGSRFIIRKMNYNASFKN